MSDGFDAALVACAVLALGGALLAWLTIDPTLRPATEDEEDYNCGLDGPPLRPANVGAETTGEINR